MTHLVICHSRKSKPSARVLAQHIRERGFIVRLNRGSEGDVNWGRANTNCTLNADISMSTNKEYMRLAFQEASIPMPQLWAGNFFPEDVSEITFPVVARAANHMQRSGMWVCDNMVELTRALDEGATHFMRFIESDHEFRVHIFNGKSIRVSEKDFTRPRSDKYLYTTMRPTVEKLRAVRQAARDAVAACNLDFGAVDILLKGDDGSIPENVYVLEVNSAPGLGGSTPRQYANAIVNFYSENEEEDADSF